MKDEFKSISVLQIQDNAFKLIGSDWMLITAGKAGDFNTMTASWGGFGILWGKNVCFTFIRPARYTYGFIEREDHFTLSFFEEKYRDILNFCGSKSGRDVDKVKATGLTPLETSGLVYFKEARLVLVCKKIYFQDINPENILVSEISEWERNCTDNAYHRMYIAEIKECLGV